jgi:hypothetical protein
VVCVDPADAIKVAADLVADPDRVVAVVALALVPGGRRGRGDGPTDLCTGAGVLGDAVVAPVAGRLVTRHTSSSPLAFTRQAFPALGEVNQPRADPWQSCPKRLPTASGIWLPCSDPWKRERLAHKWHALSWPKRGIATDAAAGYGGCGTRIRTQSRFRP